MQFTYGVGTLAIITAAVAFVVVDQIPFLFFVVIVQLVTILVATELLQRRIPRSLVTASDDNCVRIDGSVSSRRERGEQRARTKLRMDLLAVFLLVSLTGNWLAFLVHCEIIPIPMAFQSITAYNPNTDAWKKNLRDRGVDGSYGQWVVGKASVNRETVELNQRRLWDSWPVILCGSFAWLIGSAVFITKAYMKILREFAAGVATRKQTYVDRDITRLQS